MVFDIGGYEGAWAKNINCKYGCKIHIFEPIKKYTEKIKLIFEQNENVFVHNFGLGNKNETVNFTVVNDGTTIYKEGQEKETCQMIDIFSFTEKEQIDEISLMKINIEGGEYDLIDHIIENNWININNLNINCYFRRFKKN